METIVFCSTKSKDWSLEKNSGKTRLLFIMMNLQCGGAERVIVSYLNNLPRSRYEISLFVMRLEGPFVAEIPEDIPVTSGLKHGQRLSCHLLSVIKKIFRCSSAVDIIIGGLEFDTVYLSALTKMILKKRTFGWNHTDMVSYMKRIPKRHKFLTWLFYPLIDTLIFVSEDARERALKELPHLNKNKTTVLFNPIDIDKINTLSNTTYESNKIQSRPYIVSVGRLDYYKGFDLLIDAFDNIKDDMSADLIIIGEGKSRKSLVERVLRKGLQDRIRFTGFMHNPFPIIRNAQLYVSASRHEGFGLTIVEAMALGVPVVATNCRSGPSEILDNGRFGLLVPPDNVDRLSKAILFMLNDPAKRKSFGKSAASRANDFGVSTIMRQFDSLVLH